MTYLLGFLGLILGFVLRGLAKSVAVRILRWFGIEMREESMKIAIGSGNVVGSNNVIAQIKGNNNTVTQVTQDRVVHHHHYREPNPEPKLKPKLPQNGYIYAPHMYTYMEPTIRQSEIKW